MRATRFTKFDPADNTVEGWRRHGDEKGTYQCERIHITGGDKPFDHTGILEDDGKVFTAPNISSKACASYAQGGVLLPLRHLDFEEME